MIVSYNLRKLFVSRVGTLLYSMPSLIVDLTSLAAPSILRKGSMAKRNIIFSICFIVSTTASILICFFAGSNAHAVYQRQGKAEVRFHAAGPAGMKIDGVGHTVELKTQSDQLVVQVTLGDIKTGIDLRDEHMRKALETKKFPTTTLSVPTTWIAQAVRSGHGTGKGLVSLHGKQKSLPFTYTIKTVAGVHTVNAKVRINMNEFGIKPPSYLGVTVKPEVDVALSFNALE